MTRKETLALIYDTDARLLGEVRTFAGVYRSILLTPHGEDVLGETIAAWQTRGISIGQERVQLREPIFARALGAWARFMGYTLVPGMADAPVHVSKKKEHATTN